MLATDSPPAADGRRQASVAAPLNGPPPANCVEPSGLELTDFARGVVHPSPLPFRPSTTPSPTPSLTLTVARRKNRSCSPSTVRTTRLIWAGETLRDSATCSTATRPMPDRFGAALSSVGAGDAGQRPPPHLSRWTTRRCGPGRPQTG